MKKYLTQLLSALSMTKWQVAIATCSVIIYLIKYCNGEVSQIDEGYKRQLMIFMAMLGSVLALMTSLSFGFLFQFMNATNNRKHDLFTKFKSELFNFDAFLKDYPQHLEIINESQKLSWNLKTIKFEDFPVLDWEERLKGVLSYIELSKGTYENDRNLENKIIGFLIVTEEIVSDIGLMCIRQIISSAHANRVIKGFTCLAGVLFTAAVTFYVNDPAVLFILSSAPLFFVVIVLLYILELGWNLKREADEQLIFLESEENS